MQSIGIGVALSLILMVVAAFGAIPALLGAWLQEAVDLASILWALRATVEPRTRETSPQASLTEAT
jgi:cation transport ATPase